MRVLLWPILLGLLAVPPPLSMGFPAHPVPGWALADDDDDDDDDDDRPRRTVTAPAGRGLAQVAAGLQVSAIWVERSGALVRVRLGVSYGGVLVSAITLHPATAQPVGYAQRALAQPRSVPSTASLRNVLNSLAARASTQLGTAGFAVAGPDGPLLPVYWGGTLVGYLALNASGQPQQDPAVARAYSASSLRLRR